MVLALLLTVGWAAAVKQVTDHLAEGALSAEARENGVWADQMVDLLATSTKQRLDTLKAVAEKQAEAREIIALLARMTSESGSALSDEATRRLTWLAIPELDRINHDLVRLKNGFDLDTISLLNVTGDTVASSTFIQPVNFVGINRAERDYFRTAMSGQTAVQLLISYPTGAPIIVISAPVKNTGKVVGAVSISIVLSRLVSQVSRCNFHLVDEHGVILLDTKGEHLLKAMPDNRLGYLTSENRVARYGKSELDVLPISPWDRRWERGLFRVGNQPLPEFISERKDNELGLRFQVFAPLTDFPAFYEEHDLLTGAAIIGGDALILLILGGAMHVRRNRANLEQMRLQHEELTQSRERFRLIAETIPEVFWMSEPDLLQIT
ncbi:MAG: hypothetical protein WCF85_16555 [Rhodospirillaceae bacterium]